MTQSTFFILVWVGVIFAIYVLWLLAGLMANLGTIAQDKLPPWVRTALVVIVISFVITFVFVFTP